MGEEFPFDELEKVNKFIIKGGDIPQESINRINESLKRGQENGLKIIVNDTDVSFSQGGKEISFGTKNYSYSDYIKDNLEEIKLTDEEKYSQDSRDVKYKDIADEIQKKLDLPSELSKQLEKKLKVNMEPIVKLAEVAALPKVSSQQAEKLASSVSDPNQNSTRNGQPAEPAINSAKAVLESSSKDIQDLFSKQAKTQTDLDSSIKKMNEVLDKLAKDAPTQQEKSWYENAKEKFADALKLGLVGLAGFFTYEALAAHSAARTGCFVAKTDQKTGDTTVCKISNLTCNQDAAAAGDLCDSFSLQCKGKDDKVFPEGCRPCYLGIGDACNTCGGGTDSPCSKYCDSKYLVTSMNGYNYDYKCVNCDMKCAFYDMWNKVTDILSKAADAFGSIWDLINSIFKYGLYFIIGFIVLYCAYWLITKFTGGKDDKVSVEVSAPQGFGLASQGFSQGFSQGAPSAAPVAPPLISGRSVIPPINVNQEGVISQNLHTPVSGLYPIR